MGHAAHFARKALGLLAALCVIGAAPAYATCIDPSAMQAEYGVMAFTQTRHLAGLRAPLVSRGEATVAPGRVDWHVRTPANIRMSIASSGITQSIDGGPPQRVSAQGADAFLNSAGLLDLLVGNFEALSTHYTIARAPSAAGAPWSMRLTPRAAALSRFVSYIEVAGCERVAQVEVRQADGDWMNIALAAPGG